MDTLAQIVLGGAIGLVGGSAFAVCLVLSCRGLLVLWTHIRNGGRVFPPALYPPKRKTGDES